MLGSRCCGTYFGFSQYLITWAANIPEETSGICTGRRTAGSSCARDRRLPLRRAVFLVLLHRAIKRNAAMVAKVALLIIVMRLLDLYWLSAPP